VSSILDLSLTILSHEHLKRWLQSRSRRELTNQHFVFIQHPINRQTRQKQPPSTTSLQSSNLLRKQSKERLVRSSLAVCITAQKIQLASMSSYHHPAFLARAALKVLTFIPTLRAPITSTSSIPLPPTSSLLNLNLIRHTRRIPLRRIPRQKSLHLRRIETSSSRRRSRSSYRSRALLPLLRRRSITRVAALGGGALGPEVSGGL
jgi:hypothetical protein